MTTVNYFNKSRTDLEVLKILFENYDKVYAWPHGPLDYEYLKSISKTLGQDIIIIPPSLSSYDHFLSTHNIDYVGVRLHGGIRALQHGKRTIILAIDHRAILFSRSFNVSVVQRDNIPGLKEMVNSHFKTRITVKRKEINHYLKMFREYVIG